MSCVSRYLPSAPPGQAIVSVPKIHHFDEHNNVIIMEDCGPDFLNLKEFLCSGNASPNLAKIIGTALGEFIASVHEWSRNNPDGILDVFHTNSLAKNAAIELNYDRLVATLRQTDKYDLPLLAGLNTDPSDIGVIAKLAAEYRAHLLAPTVSDRDVVSSWTHFFFQS